MNGEEVASALSFPATGDWKTWSEASVAVYLTEGANVVKLVAAGSSGANIDSLTIAGVAADGCAAAQNSVQDQGYNDAYRGWYDVQGCGECNDYCRWVGNSGSGGDPAVNFAAGSTDNGSWWSCRMAGSDETYSARGIFTSFNFAKCQ